jgi:DNA-binding CsgD family transcriptional regulator/PAS domain-containing protein
MSRRPIGLGAPLLKILYALELSFGIGFLEGRMLDGQTLRALDTVVSCFYDASLGKVTWEEPLRLAATAMDAHNAVFSVRDPVTRKAHFSFGNFGTKPEFARNFAQTYATLSPFVIATAIAPEGKAVNPIEMIGREEYERGRFHREWSAPQKYHDYVGAILLRQPHAIYTIAFGRTTDRPLFSEREKQVLDFLAPHVTRALMISERLNTFEKERDELLMTLDSLAVPIFLLDRQARVRQCNTAALGLIESGCGASNRDGSLVFEDPVLAKEFLSLCAIETGHAVVLKSKLRGGLQVQILARNISGGDNRDRLLVVIDRPVSSAPPLAENIMSRFGITISELRVLLLLIDAKSVKDIATDLGLSHNTVKTHISHMFQKTGTNSQRGLLKSVSAATHGNGPQRFVLSSSAQITKSN